MIQCPGCGGRNPENAVVCDWCARPLRGASSPERSPRRIGLPIVIGVVLIAIALVTVIALSSLSRSGTIATPVVVVSSPLPAASPRAIAPTSIPTITPLPPSTPVVRSARIVNTNGEGALIRLEPSVNAPSAGLVREDGVVTLLGPEETVQAQVWRQVEDAQGNQGWIRADYLAQVEAASPMPLAPPP